MIARIRKDDTVIVISGRDKGKTGMVIEVLPKKKKAFVKGIAIVTKHAKPRRQGEAGSIKKKESNVDLSTLMPVCGACKKPCRINTKRLKEGNCVRVCNRCKEVF
ncbi:50S ribosomal protein L24 [Candidatus Dependentiae bacterium]|nr:MAG: 50S ribosomal protein L24 [Candidatus Dependentiae bacterium]